MPTILAPDALETFRALWTGDKLLGLVAENQGKCLFNWAIGVGKSYAIDEMVVAATESSQHDLVVVLAPTRAILNERRWNQHPPPEVKIINLRPRPRRQCGPDRDAAWVIFERGGLGALGRREVCGPCPRRSKCAWPGQYGKRLRGAKLIFGTQAHLSRTSGFLLQLRQWAKAQSMLVLLDEMNFLMSSFRHQVTRRDLDQFQTIVSRMNPKKGKARHQRWRYLADLLQQAATHDLRCTEWAFPYFTPEWAFGVQALGWQIFGDSFRFLGYDLLQFGYSLLDSRERAPNGDLLFATPPYMLGDFVIFSDSAHQEFTRFRLGRDFANPFADYCFAHPETKWFNLASRLGTKGFFPKNAPQILDFFANLIADRLQQGRRPLLITKKCFASFCAREIERRLHASGRLAIHLATQDFTSQILADPHTVPLIHYGLIGINAFEHFDCAFCLTGYYVNERVVNQIVQDVLGSDGHIPIRICTQGRPRRRHVEVVNQQNANYDVAQLAQLALDHQEMGVVLQAVGRVRPYTKPREIFTFQCADHPQLTYTREFHSLGEAREYFCIHSRQTYRREQRRATIQQARAAGLTQRQTAQRLGVSLSTVKRGWHHK